MGDGGGAGEVGRRARGGGAGGGGGAGAGAGKGGEEEVASLTAIQQPPGHVRVAAARGPRIVTCVNTLQAAGSCPKPHSDSSPLAALPRK